tara:strand:- start:1222 stop:1971 length:750 start_codon:yes stop_codon:yes gene_type:complete
MKKLLITGVNGTLAPVVAELFRRHQWQTIAWDRHRVSPEDEHACEQFWQQVSPDAVCHLAMGSEDWAAWFARKTAHQELPYLFTSTAMVFDCERNGPYNIHSERNAKDGYGQYKMRCEDRIFAENPHAIVPRIGWQIGAGRGGNNMLEHLFQQMENDGQINASSNWYPACSLMEDTAAAIYELVIENQPGIFHVDSNRYDKLSFLDIVQRLNNHHQANWNIVEDSSYQHDQRLIDGRVGIANLTDWLDR